MSKVEQKEMTEQEAPATTSKTPKQNPVRAFEDSAKSIWMSDDGYLEKAVKLRDLSEGITHYVTRLKAYLNSKPLDTWTKLSMNRTMAYLIQLGEDVKGLSTACQSQAVSRN